MLHRLWRQLPRKRQGQFFLIVGMMLLGAAAEVVTLGAVLPFLAFIADPAAASRYPGVDRVLAALNLDGGDDLLLSLALLFATAAVVAACIRIVLAWVSNRYVFLAAHDLGVNLYSRVLHQPYSYHVSRSTSDVLAATAKVDLVANGVLVPIMQSISSVVIGVFIVAALLAVDPLSSAAAMAAFILLYVSISLVFRKGLRSQGRTIATVQSQRIRTLQEGLGGIRDVLVDGAQPVFVKKFSALDADFREALAKSIFISAAPRFVIEAAGMVLIALLAYLLSSKEGGLAETLPVLGVLALGAQRLLPLAQYVYVGWARITSTSHVMTDILDMLEAPRPKDEGAAAAAALPFDGKIEFRDVALRYEARDRPAVEGLNFTIRKGCKVGVIGKSGSGKSTTIDLLMGLLEPTSGRIEIDGRRLEESTRRSWQRQVAHVPQAIFLADTSFLENIAFGVDPADIDEARVREAARRAELAEFIESLPKGYGASVGERGVRLSGGQRQRIGIARALYKQASVLIFDEATSGLDHETEDAVMAAIAALPRDLTVVLVAHKVSTLAFCDQIVRLDSGRLRAVGTYDEVVRREVASSLTL